MLERRTLQPSSAWLVAFLPALLYFIATRFNASSLWDRSAGVATVFNLHGDCSGLSDVFYTECADSGANPDIVRLKHPVILVQSEGLNDVVATLWRHDSELGRGYLLISQRYSGGRIWRWEVGGGPIPIGKTLHMDPSGCRSNQYRSCTQHAGNTGSASLAVDFLDQEQAAEGRLVVVELGEGRIVRMEESGARTPLVIQLPSLCVSERTSSRLHQPGQLLYTPFGDLLFIDNHVDCGGGIFRLRNAMRIGPIASLGASREAHSWNSTLNHNETVEIVYQHGIDRVCGIALDTTWTGIYAVVVRNESSLLLHLTISNTDADEEDIESMFDGTSRVMYHLGKLQHAQSGNVETGVLAVDRLGRIFVTVPDGVKVLDEHGSLLGSIPMHKPPTSLTLGEDGFLYISTRDQLLRIKVKAGPIKVPTNMVLKP